jgi:hypothetical protein
MNKILAEILERHGVVHRAGSRGTRPITPILVGTVPSRKQ